MIRYLRFLSIYYLVSTICQVVDILENVFHSIKVGISKYIGGTVASRVSGLTSPALRPCQGHCAVFLGITVPLSTQVYKWIPSNLILWVTLRWTSITSRGE